MSTPYFAYFSRLEGLGTPFPVLHAPDRMIINANMIELVEPESPGSRVAQLIAQAKINSSTAIAVHPFPCIHGNGTVE